MSIENPTERPARDWFVEQEAIHLASIRRNRNRSIPLAAVMLSLHVSLPWLGYADRYTNLTEVETFRHVVILLQSAVCLLLVPFTHWTLDAGIAIGRRREVLRWIEFLDHLDDKGTLAKHGLAIVSVPVEPKEETG